MSSSKYIWIIYLLLYPYHIHVCSHDKKLYTMSNDNMMIIVPLTSLNNNNDLSIYLSLSLYIYIYMYDKLAKAYYLATVSGIS